MVTYLEWIHLFIPIYNEAGDSLLFLLFVFKGI